MLDLIIYIVCLIGLVIASITDIKTTAVTPGNPIGPITIEIVNNTDSKFDFLEKPYIITPTDAVLWYRPRPKSIPAAHTRTNNSRVSTSPRLAPGKYTYGIMLTDTEGSEIDNDSFEFEVKARSIPAPGPTRRTPRRTPRRRQPPPRTNTPSHPPKNTGPRNQPPPSRR